mmetsp:Transcript_14165/g.9936  ORF Transcript_14165/g.9936 Transcript_14165/m.9936 type:complete len:132 (+) Transcript_14165:1779-2174(+)
MSIMTSIFMMIFSSKKLMSWFNSTVDNGNVYTWNEVVIIAVIIEHALIALKFILQLIIPDIPNWILILKRRGRQVKADLKDEFGMLKLTDQLTRDDDEPMTGKELIENIAGIEVQDDDLVRELVPKLMASL